MKVILVNGSPHINGCTNRALQEIEKTLQEEGIETEVYWIGNQAISGCIGCNTCNKQKKCVINDKVNEFVEKAKHADGFIFGSPVHYSSASGALTSFMDRVFYSAARTGEDIFYLKPAASVVSARRAGTTATFDQLNKYFTISQMPIISSSYWNNVHGRTVEDVEKDEEGLQVMRILGRNMAFHLKCKELALKEGIAFPKRESKLITNFIRE